MFNDSTLLNDLKLYLEERKKKIGIHKEHLFLTRANEKYASGDNISLNIKKYAKQVARKLAAEGKDLG